MIEHERTVKAMSEKQRQKKKLKPISKREETFTDKVAEFLATNEVPRSVALAMQAVADSQVNPMSVYMRLGNLFSGNGYRTGLENAIEPENKFERGGYEATKTAYDTLVGASGGGLLATSKTVTKAGLSSNKLKRGAAKAVQQLLYPGVYLPQVGATEGALAATLWLIWKSLMKMLV